MPKPYRRNLRKITTKKEKRKYIHITMDLPLNHNRCALEIATNGNKS